MAADFNKPTVTSAYTAFPAEVRDNFAAAVTMHETDASGNKPTAAKQITATGIINRWDGSQWVTLADPAGHAASTANPHGVTAAQAGAPVINHSHNASGSEGPKLAQANTHESADTDGSAGALHHTIGTGATQAAAGNHTHSYTNANPGSAAAAALGTGATSATATLTLTGIASATGPDIIIPFDIAYTEVNYAHNAHGHIVMQRSSETLTLVMAGAGANPSGTQGGAVYVGSAQASARASTSYTYWTVTVSGAETPTLRVGYKKGGSADECLITVDDSGTTTFDNIFIGASAYKVSI
jgi:hypothetical protein